MKNSSDKILIAFIMIFLVATSAFAVEDYHTVNYFNNQAFIGNMYINSWKIDQAYEMAQKLIKEDPKNKSNRFLMCLALFYSGKYEEALEYIDEDNPDGKFIFDVIKITHEQTKDFLRKEGEHFIVSYKPGRDAILADDALSALEGAYENLGKDLGFYPKSKLIVEIYPTVNSFTAVSTLTKEEIETSGTIALCKFNRLMITSPRVLLRGYRWRRTLCHEYVHYIVYNLSGSKAPIWIHEGIAKYLEDRFSSDVVGAIVPTSESLLSMRLKNDTLVTIEQMSPSMAKLKSGEDVQLAFAEVNSMVEYMVKLKGFQSIKNLLAQMNAGKEDYQAIESVFDVPLIKFQEEWRNYAIASDLREIPGMHITGMDVKLKSNEELSDEAIESEELKGEGHSKEEREFITLGNLLRDRGRTTAASFEYEKGYKESPFSIVSLTKLGYSYMLENRLDEALKILYEAMELYPDYVTTYYRLGLTYLAKEDYDKSLKYFNESLEINPFIPAVRENMIHIYNMRGDEESAKKHQKILDVLQEQKTPGHK